MLKSSFLDALPSLFLDNRHDIDTFFGPTLTSVLLALSWCDSCKCDQQYILVNGDRSLNRWTSPLDWVQNRLTKAKEQMKQQRRRC